MFGSAPNQAAGSFKRPEIRQASEFSITDDYGISHDYVVTPHGASEGWKLGAFLLKILAPAIGVTLDSLNWSDMPKAFTEVGQGMAETLSDGEEGEGGKVDLARVAGALSGLAGHLLDQPALVSELLKYTARDGAPVSSIFDQAYQANYGELGVALGRVVAVNFGPLFTQRLGSQWTSLQGLLNAGPRETPAESSSKPATVG